MHLFISRMGLSNTRHVLPLKFEHMQRESLKSSTPHIDLLHGSMSKVCFFIFETAPLLYPQRNAFAYAIHITISTWDVPEGCLLVWREGCKVDIVYINNFGPLTAQDPLPLFIRSIAKPWIYNCLECWGRLYKLSLSLSLSIYIYIYIQVYKQSASTLQLECLAFIIIAILYSSFVWKKNP